MKTWHPSEDDEQIAVVTYLTYKGLLFHHSPNEGKRTARTGARLKSLGTKPGFPDLFVYEPRGRYKGLAIEMKTLTGRPTKEQKQWISDLKARGYASFVCHGANEAICIIDKYLTQKEG